ncbi:MAG: hypothetical protein AB8G77_25890 [Rhodothermales bacterium]
MELKKILDHKTLEEFPNYIEFNIQTPSDVIRIGFAARKEELTYWGRVGFSLGASYVCHDLLNTQALLVNWPTTTFA